MGCFNSHPREVLVIIDGYTDKEVTNKIETFFYKQSKIKVKILGKKTKNGHTYYFLSDENYITKIEVEYEYYIKGGKIYNIIYPNYTYIVSF